MELQLQFHASKWYIVNKRRSPENVNTLSWSGWRTMNSCLLVLLCYIIIAVNCFAQRYVPCMCSLHSTPLTGRAIKPQRQGHIGGPIAQPWGGRGGYVCVYAWCVGRKRGGRRGLCIVFSMAPNFNAGSVSPLTSYATAPSRPARPLPAASPYTPVGPIGRPWVSRQAAGRPPSGQSSRTACRVSIPPVAPTTAEQPSLNSATATCHIF